MQSMLFHLYYTVTPTDRTASLTQAASELREGISSRATACKGRSWNLNPDILTEALSFGHYTLPLSDQEDKLEFRKTAVMTREEKNQVIYIYNNPNMVIN